MRGAARQTGDWYCQGPPSRGPPPLLDRRRARVQCPRRCRRDRRTPGRSVAGCSQAGASRTARGSVPGGRLPGRPAQRSACPQERQQHRAPGVPSLSEPLEAAGWLHVSQVRTRFLLSLVTTEVPLWPTWFRSDVIGTRVSGSHRRPDRWATRLGDTDGAPVCRMRCRYGASHTQLEGRRDNRRGEVVPRGW